MAASEKSRKSAPADAPPPITIPLPSPQADFAAVMLQVRELYLQDALSATIANVSIAQLDRELIEYVPESYLKAMAMHGLRGELLFAVPCVLTANPRLLAYYRLLIGFGQKTFYRKGTGLSPFRAMEDKGSVPRATQGRVGELCRRLVEASCALLDGMGVVKLSKELLDDLTLLTLGAQLRGGANVRIGMAGILRVVQAIEAIVNDSVVSKTPECIELRNAAGRRVFIRFAQDPDITISEEMSPGNYRNIVAVEVKSGTDAANIHNRIGEAEKSHRKAMDKGFLERWTVINVELSDVLKAKSESPSTDRFYELPRIEAGSGVQFTDFRDRVISLTGIPTTARNKRL